MPKTHSICVLPGDGIGEEVIDCARRVLDALTAAGVDSTLNILPGIEHGWNWNLTHDRIVEFFERTLKA